MTFGGCTGSPETDANDGSGSSWRDAHARGGAPRLRGHRHDHFPFLRPRRNLVRTHPSLWRVRIQEAPGGAPPRRSDPLVRSPGRDSILVCLLLRASLLLWPDESLRCLGHSRRGGTGRIRTRVRGSHRQAVWNPDLGCLAPPPTKRRRAQPFRRTIVRMSESCSGWSKPTFCPGNCADDPQTFAYRKRLRQSRWIASHTIPTSEPALTISGSARSASFPCGLRKTRMNRSVS